MSLEAVIGGANILERELARLVPLAELEELSLHRAHGRTAHFTKDSAGLRQDELRFEKYNAACDRADFGLAQVERDTELGAYLFDSFEAILQIVNILVNQIAIVHIPAVALNAKLFLDNMVELVRKHEGRILRDLTAETIPDRAEVLEEVIRELSGLRVVNTTGELVLDGPVLRRAEVILEVEDENTAFETVLAEMSLQVAVETVHCEVDALALDACGIVINKRRLKNLCDNLVAEISLNGALCDMDAANMTPFSAIVNVKLIEASAFICSSHQLGMGPRGIRDDVHSVALRRAFPVDILAAYLSCLKQAAKREGLLKAAASNAAGEPFGLPPLTAALIPKLVPLFACHRLDCLLRTVVFIEHVL